MRRSLALVPIVVLAALLPGAVAADDIVALRYPPKPVFWSGGPVQGAAVPEACGVLACDEVTLHVSVARRWLRRPANLQVAIRWRGESNNLDLYLYGRDGQLAAHSSQPFSTAESVLLPLVNGTYRVVVVPMGSDPVRYRGLAQVERTTRAKPTRRLLPDLRPLPIRRPQIATGAYVFDAGFPGLPTGCYPEETFEQRAMRCLRFDQPVANVGDGPFEVRYRLEDVAGKRALEQRIYRSNGTWRDRHADTYEFHPTHAHFHYVNFAQSHLWRSNARGDRLGTAPLRSSNKNGFCMFDVELHWWGRRGDAPRTYSPSACVAPNEIDPAAGKFTAVNGISVGWADVYFWYVPDQYIEISGVPNGYYVIESVSDPDNTAVESNDANNSAYAHIQICGDSAQIAGNRGPCSE